LNASNGCAPERNLPLTKNAGVPCAPIWSPSFWCSRISSLSFGSAMSRSKRPRLSPISAAYFFRLSSSSAFWFSNSLSWYSQNLPCRCAAIDASAAGIARWWKPSGLCLNAIRTSLPYAS
jgi:hypothetical protein